MPFRRRKQKPQQQQQLAQWETIFWFRTTIVAGCMLALWCGLLAFEHYSCPGLSCWRIHSSIAAADGTRRRTSSSLLVSVATTAAENHHLPQWAAKGNALRKVQQPQLQQLDAQAKLIDDESSFKQPTSMKAQKLSVGENATTDTTSIDADSHALQQALARKHKKHLPLDENEALVFQNSTETQRLRDEENEAVERDILHNEEEWLMREIDHELLVHQQQQQEEAETINHPEDDVNLQQRAQSPDQPNSLLPAGQQNLEEEQNENAELSVLQKEEEWLTQEMDNELLLLQHQQESSTKTRSVVSPTDRDAAIELETLRKEEEWVAKELEAEGVKQLPQPQDPMLQQQQTENNKLTSPNLLNRMELDILHKEEEWATREIHRFHRAQGTLPVRHQDEEQGQMDIAATAKNPAKLPNDFVIDASHLQTRFTAAASAFAPMATEHR